MRWFIAFGWLVVGLLSGFAAIAGSCEGGLATLWPPESWTFHWETLWRPSVSEAGLLTLSVAGVVFALATVLRPRGRFVELSKGERWGTICINGLVVSLLLMALSLTFVFLGPNRGATEELTGAVFLAGAVQATVALLLVGGLFFLPKSKAGFAALIVVWLLEAGVFAALYAFGSGIEI